MTDTALYDHVVACCRRELEPDLVDATVERILRIASDWSQQCGGHVAKCVVFATAQEIDRLRTPERRAQLEREFEAVCREAGV